MSNRAFLASLLLVAALCTNASHAAPASASSPLATPGPCPAKPDWNTPARPAHVFGNTWFVGTCGISAILITSPDGHILIDTATEAAAPAIEANIRALGFHVEDIRYILSSHEHLDHIGGLAKLQKDSGASVVAREPAATTLERGSNASNDPQFGNLGDFPPLSRVRRIADGETLSLGALRLTAHATPAHTPGSTSWTWTACEGETCQRIAYADSLTAVSAKSYRFSDEASHPGTLAAFRNSLKVVAELPCDILLTPHPSASRMFQRLGLAASERLVDGTACQRYAAKAGADLNLRLSSEQATP